MSARRTSTKDVQSNPNRSQIVFSAIKKKSDLVFRSAVFPYIYVALHFMSGNIEVAPGGTFIFKCLTSNVHCAKINNVRVCYFVSKSSLCRLLK